MGMLDIKDWAEWVALIAGVALFAYICMGDLLRALGFFAYRSGIGGGPSDLEPDGIDPRYQDQYHQLSRLEFQPLGMTWYRSWGMSGQDRVLCSSKEPCTAAVEKSGVVFSTVFTTGEVVRTSSYPMEEQDNEHWLATGIATNRLEDVLTQHRKGVARFREAGKIPRSCSTLEDFHEIEIVKFNNRGVQRWLRRTFAFIFWVKAGFLGLLPMFFAGICWWMGWPFLLPAIVLLGLCSFYLVFEKARARQVRKEVADEQKAADLARQVKVPPAPGEAIAVVTRELRDKMQPQVWSLSGPVVWWVADRLGSLFLPEHVGFDLQRGFLGRRGKLDLVESIASPCPFARDSTGLLVWQWEESAVKPGQARFRFVTLLAQAIGFGCTTSLTMFGIGFAIVGVYLQLLGLLTWRNLEKAGVFVLPEMSIGVVGAIIWSVWRAFHVSQRFDEVHWGNLRRNVEGDSFCEFRYSEILGVGMASAVKCRVGAKEIGAGRWVLHGMAQFWHPTGEASGKIEFAEGKPNGLVQTWYPWGQLKSQGQWDHGRKVGVWQRWDEAGQRLAVAVYESGRCVQSEGDFDADPNWGHLGRYHWACPAVAVRGKVTVTFQQTQDQPSA